MCVLIFFTNLIWNVSHSKTNSSRYHKRTSVVLYSAHYSCQIVMKLGFVRQIFQTKSLKYWILWKSVQWQPSCFMRTDGKARDVAMLPTHQKNILCLLDRASLWQLKNKRPTWSHVLFYFTSYVLNTFRTLIYPSSGACDYSVELPHWSYCSSFDACWSFGVVGLEWYPCCRLKLWSTCFGH